ncbi:hypothetical protein TeGR_g5003 [Tetraparma gracilis]|uniref:Uncharacterized protein n=1 Tax=Tetraparma gracilis TaxID=2962635 RepID=A0ABQ6M8F4_9STRA|nr:hypothetical protein TeGR_g5003 [Tetraparma gracilis]
MYSSTDTAALSLLWFFSSWESYRFILVLQPVAYRHRLSCYFTHLVTVGTTVQLILHFLGTQEGAYDYPPGRHAYMYSLVHHIVSAVADNIAVMFFFLIVAFKANMKQLVTPMENQKIDLFRLVTNFYIHYCPSLCYHLVATPPPVISHAAAVGTSVWIILLWLTAYWDTFDECYGLKFKGSRPLVPTWWYFGKKKFSPRSVSGPTVLST